MELVEKLSKIQQQMKAPKNLYNRFGKYYYRNAESILEAFKGFETEHNVALIISDEVVIVGERIYIQATATIMDCETKEQISVKAFARESFDKKGMDDSQITGAASSYARKYALSGLFLLDDTNDADSEENKKEQEEKYADVIAEKRKTIEEICKRHNLTPAAICKANRCVWEKLDEEMLDKIIKSLKNKYADE